MSNRIWQIILAVSLIIVVVSGVNVFRLSREYQKGINEYEKLEQYVSLEENQTADKQQDQSAQEEEQESKIPVSVDVKYDELKIIPVLFLTMGFGLIGFLDDYIKVVLKRSMGLHAWQKFSLQIVVTGIFTYYLLNYTDVSLAMKVPFMDGVYLDFGWFNIPLLFFIVIGTVNGTNFTDGLDGLASSVTVLVATFFTVVAIGTNSGIEPITCAVVGALLGFLLFNVHPASVFMGDTGSLALGGFVAATAYVMQMPLRYM